MSNKENIQQCLDARGLVCPMPLLKMRLALSAMQEGEYLQVLASDAGSWRDIPKYLEKSPYRLISAQQQQQDYVFVIKK